MCNPTVLLWFNIYILFHTSFMFAYFLLQRYNGKYVCTQKTQIHIQICVYWWDQPGVYVRHTHNNQVPFLWFHLHSFFRSYSLQIPPHLVLSPQERILLAIVCHLQFSFLSVSLWNISCRRCHRNPRGCPGSSNPQSSSTCQGQLLPMSKPTKLESGTQALKQHEREDFSHIPLAVLQAFYYSLFFLECLRAWSLGQCKQNGWHFPDHLFFFADSVPGLCVRDSITFSLRSFTP